MSNFTPEQVQEILDLYFENFAHRQYIGARYVPIFGRKGETSIEWDNSAPYEPLTIVLYEGNSYTSRQFVPAGVAITNNAYWAETGNFNAQIEQYRQEVLDIANILPSTDFDAENTVKDYIDGVDAKLGSGFDAENTVSDSFEAVNERIEQAATMVINVKHPNIEGLAGLTGDGETDDSAALQAIIDYLHTSQSASEFFNGMVFFPRGQYVLHDIEISNPHIRFSGCENGSAKLLLTSGHDNMFTISASFVYFDNLMIWDNTHEGNLFDISDCRVIHLRQCQIYDALTAIKLEDVGGFQIFESAIAWDVSAPANCIGIEMNGVCDAGTIENTTINMNNSSGSYGIKISDYASDLIIVNNYIVQCNNGIYIASDATHTNSIGIIIGNVYFDEFITNGIFCDSLNRNGYNAMQISNCTFNGMGGSVGIRINKSDNVITSNCCFNNNHSVTNTYGLVVIDSKNVKISDSLFNNLAYGVYFFTDIYNIGITGCTFDNRKNAQTACIDGQLASGVNISGCCGRVSSAAFINLAANVNHAVIVANMCEGESVVPTITASDGTNVVDNNVLFQLA